MVTSALLNVPRVDASLASVLADEGGVVFLGLCAPALGRANHVAAAAHMFLVALAEATLLAAAAPGDPDLRWLVDELTQLFLDAARAVFARDARRSS